MKYLLRVMLLWVWWLGFFLIGRGRDINGITDQVLKGKQCEN